MSLTRSQQKQRITNLLLTRFDSIDDTAISALEAQSHWAKYLSVLVSGYLEQSFKNILIGYCAARSNGQVIKGVENLWPKSKNMTYKSICELLESFNKDWMKEIEVWFAEDAVRKSDVNGIIAWRNNIAHGNDANTTNVTIPSLKQKFSTVNALLDKIELIVG